MESFEKNIFQNIICIYIESKEENGFSIKENSALDEIMHWNPKKAIDYFKEKYPEYSNHFNNYKDYDSVPKAILIDIIDIEIERIIENMLVD